MGLAFLQSSAVPTHPRIWRGDELVQADGAVVESGHAVLDAELPGGGWPVGAMSELLVASPEAHAWQLLLPALSRVSQQAEGGCIALVGAPCEPYGPALAARGLPVEALLWVRAEAGAARLWAAEQALRCADVGAVLAWLPQARVPDLRRLQLAAAQHEALLFVFRPCSVAAAPSPARLRLRLEPCADDPSSIELHLLKRRGPPLAAPVQLPARNERMAALLAASRLRRRQRRQEEGQALPNELGRLRLELERRDALDRLVVAA